MAAAYPPLRHGPSTHDLSVVAFPREAEADSMSQFEMSYDQEIQDHVERKQREAVSFAQAKRHGIKIKLATINIFTYIPRRSTRSAHHASVAYVDAVQDSVTKSIRKSSQALARTLLAKAVKADKFANRETANPTTPRTFRVETAHHHLRDDTVRRVVQRHVEP